MISAGQRSLILQTELKEKICKDRPFNIVFEAQNLNGQPVEDVFDYRYLMNEELFISGER